MNELVVLCVADEIIGRVSTREICERSSLAIKIGSQCNF